MSHPPPDTKRLKFKQGTKQLVGAYTVHRMPEDEQIGYVRKGVSGWLAWHTNRIPAFTRPQKTRDDAAKLLDSLVNR